MTAPEPPPSSPDEATQHTADRLALALEEVGFDVGRDFPSLGARMGVTREWLITFGDVRPAVAARLADLLIRSNRQH
jgi:hypothetical protein